MLGDLRQGGPHSDEIRKTQGLVRSGAPPALGAFSERVPEDIKCNYAKVEVDPHFKQPEPAGCLLQLVQLGQAREGVR